MHIDDPQSEATPIVGPPENSNMVDLAVFIKSKDRIQRYFPTSDSNYGKSSTCLESEWVFLKYAEEYGRQLATGYLLDPVHEWFKKRIYELDPKTTLTRTKPSHGW